MCPCERPLTTRTPRPDQRPPLGWRSTQDAQQDTSKTGPVAVRCRSLGDSWPLEGRLCIVAPLCVRRGGKALLPHGGFAAIVHHHRPGGHPTPHRPARDLRERLADYMPSADHALCMELARCAPSWARGHPSPIRQPGTTSSPPRPILMPAWRSATPQRPVAGSVTQLQVGKASWPSGPVLMHLGPRGWLVTDCRKTCPTAGRCSNRNDWLPAGSTTGLAFANCACLPSAQDYRLAHEYERGWLLRRLGRSLGQYAETTVKTQEPPASPRRGAIPWQAPYMCPPIPHVSRLRGHARWSPHHRRCARNGRQAHGRGLGLFEIARCTAHEGRAPAAALHNESD